MPTLKVPLNNFQYGEISPSLSSRTDSELYSNSGEEIRNFWIRSEGGLLKRSGTKYIETIDQYIYPETTIDMSGNNLPQLGNSFTLTTHDGTVHTFEMQGSGSSDTELPSLSVGNKHYFRIGINDPAVSGASDVPNGTKENIRRLIESDRGGIAEFSATLDTSPNDHVLVIKRTAVGNGYLETSSTDPEKIVVEDFYARKMEYRIEPFVFSDDEKYLIMFAHHRVHFYRLDNVTGDPVFLDPFQPQDTSYVSTSSIAALWLRNEKGHEYVQEFTYAQKGDVMFVAHNRFQTKMIRRTGLLEFEIVDFEFDQDRLGHKIYQPYFPFQPAGVTITTSGTQGTVTLTTSFPYFVLPQSGNASVDPSIAGSAGTDLLIHNTRVRITSITNTTTATGVMQGAMKIDLEIDSLRTIEGSNRIIVTDALHGMTHNQGITVARAGSLGGIPLGNINGSRTVIYKDENTYEITAGSNATSSAIGGGTPEITATTTTVNWSEASYSHLRGYPAAVAFHQNRLWFGGSTSQPDGIWASRSGVYFNFDTGDGEDNDAIDMSSNVGSIDQIRHLVSNRDLQVFTAESELYIQAPSTKPITPSNAQILKQTPFGSSFVIPHPFDGATLFVQEGGGALREFLFTDQESAYTSVAVSAYAPHLIRNPTQQTVIKGALARSENYSFLVNQDGTIAVFYSVRGEKKAGWSLWDTRGVWHSICSVRDNLYAIAVRKIGQGESRIVLEKFDTSMQVDYGRIMQAVNIKDDTTFADYGPQYSDTWARNGGDVFHINNGNWGGIDGVNIYYFNTPFQKGLYGNYLQTLDVINGNDYLGSFTTPLETSTQVGQASKFSGRIILHNIKDNVRDVQLGYAFTPKLKTLPIDAMLATGPLTGEPREISKVIVDFNTTLSAQIKAPSETSTARDLIITETNTNFSQEKIPFTGKKEFRTLGYNKDPRVIVSQVSPLNLQVNGLVVEISY